MKWDESEHPRDEDGKFTDGSTGARSREDRLRELEYKFNSDSELRQSEPSDVLDRDNYSEYPTVKLPSQEYAVVMSELATNLTKEEQGQYIVIRSIRNFTYVIENRGFGNYRVIKKLSIKPRR